MIIRMIITYLKFSTRVQLDLSNYNSLWWGLMVGLITAVVILIDTYASAVGAYLLNHLLLWQLNKYFHLRCLHVFAVAPFTSISHIQ